MKKVFFIFLPSVLLCGAVSCMNLGPEAPAAIENTISASIEEGEPTKTSLQNSGKVFWSKNDKIAIFPDDQASPGIFYLTSGEGTTTGTFSGYGVGTRYIAYYPAPGEISRKGDNEISVVFPTEQGYAPGTFADGSAPMVAAGSESKLSFRNLSSVLKLSITGNHTVTKVVFRANDKSIKVSGEALVNVSNPSNPGLTIASGGRDSLYVNAGKISLSESKATDFYLAVPPLKYKGGFTVRIITTTGYMDKVFNSDFTMERSRVHESTPFAVKLTSGVEPSTSLEGLGTPDNPFRIGSLGDLILFQTAANIQGGTIKTKTGGSVNASSASYLMTADIDLSPACSKAAGLNWTPIGIQEQAFSGNFDGGGHRISKLYINAPEQEFQGLFGSSVGTISNLSVEGTIEEAGLYAGLLGGFVSNVINCSSSGSIFSRSTYEGGLVGVAESVRNCTNYANVSSFIYTRFTGGVAGYAASVVACSNYGDILGDEHIGGVCGYASETVADCVNEGTVTAILYPCGGVVGETDGAIVVNCVNTGRVEACDKLGGIVGNAKKSKVYNCANYGMIAICHLEAGGIVGVLGNENLGGDTYSEMQNCISTGTFTNYSSRVDFYYSASDYAGLCGKIVGAQRGVDRESKAFQDSSAEYSYWLYPVSEGLDIKNAVAILEGKASNLFPLTAAQMKGSDCGKALYKSSTKIVDALNAWVANHPAPSSWNVSIKQWKYDSKTGYPVMK